MKKLITLVLVGLLAVSLVGPASAKKKKKKPPSQVSVEQKFFLRNPEGGCAPESYMLLLTDGEDASTCGDHAAGILAEAMITALGEPCEPSGLYGCTNLVYSAREGLPITLDASKELKGMIAVGSWASEGTTGAGNGAGATHLVIEITGTRGGESVVIGTAEAEYVVTPAQSVYENEFSMKIDPALDKAQFDSLELNLTNRGASVEHSWYELEDPASFITVPSWVTSK